MSEFIIDRYSKQSSPPTPMDVALLDSILDNAPFGFAFCDRQLRFQVVNNIMAEFNGDTPENHYGKTINQVMPSGKFVSAQCLQVLKTGEPVHNMERAAHDPSTGKLRYWLMSHVPIRMPTGEVVGVGILVSDVSQLKHIELKLHKAVAAREEFISIASHELKTPITTIKAFIQLLQRRFKNASDKTAKEYLSRSDVQLSKLTQLIKDLLDVSKIEAGKLTIQPEVFDLSELVSDTVVDFLPMSGKHKVRMRRVKEAWVYGDRNRIGQVLMNFLANAVKYSPRADRILVTMAKSENAVIVRVTDFGLGIPKNYQKRIFERFFRAADQDIEVMPSLGLGLYISREIIRSQKGTIGVKSVEGEGSTFFFSLPLRKVKK